MNDGQRLDPALAAALAKKGYDTLTPVQEAVLDPALAGRDLRITSQTGSGKTVAIGFALRALLAEDAAATSGVARPRALVIAPTRELAKQVEEELTWLYKAIGARVVSVTGGASIRDERRALASGPHVVVGTPGRLLDHIERGGVDVSGLAAVVMDEADRMLDLGFRETLESILARTPPARTTHLVSATFPRDVRALADRVQRDPYHLEATRLGAPNADIDHVIYLVDPSQRVDALINVLVAHPGEQVLVFARTRADVAHITAELAEAGFSVRSLSGEMEQRERNRALAAFKRGELRALVATDVAARGIDVDVARVLHMEPPADPDAYTHRSGRTGRAGRKGTSAVLASPREFLLTARILKRAGIAHRFEPIPTPEIIRRERDERLIEELTAEEPPSGLLIDERAEKLARRLAESGAAERTIARLLAREAHASGPQPREVDVVAPPAERTYAERMRDARDPRGARRRDDGPSARFGDGPRDLPPRARSRGPNADAPGEYASFHVSWGEAHGADARRLLALVCRRGGIRGSDVGAIRVGRTFSMVEVSKALATSFAEAVRAPDPRDPRVVIRPDAPQGRGAPPPPAPVPSGFSVPRQVAISEPSVPAARPSRPRAPAAPPVVNAAPPPPRPSRPRAAVAPPIVSAVAAPPPRPSRPRQAPAPAAVAAAVAPPARHAPAAKPSSRTTRVRPGEGAPKRPKPRTGKKRPPSRG